MTATATTPEAQKMIDRAVMICGYDRMSSIREHATQIAARTDLDVDAVYAEINGRVNAPKKTATCNFCGLSFRNCDCN